MKKIVLFSEREERLVTITQRVTLNISNRVIILVGSTGTAGFQQANS